ncbi:MAG: type IV secretion system protein VirB10 [Proteobacteria bacterium]|nr:type IV secretion system protein VirB10 [Pseudomonadota bacterium]
MKRNKKHRHADPTPESDDTGIDQVRGERGAPSVSTARSLQSRASSVMACGLMIILGAGMLAWYYSGAMTRQARAERSARSAVAHRAQGEMPLPALNGFNSFKASANETAAPTPPPVQMASTPPTELPLMQPGTAVVRPAPHKSPEQQALERLLSGAAYARESGGRSAVAALANATADSRDYLPPATPDSAGPELGSLLRPTATASARAKVLPTQRFLLPKGAFVDCTLETAINSTLPGMTTCITATDTFSSDGTVVLLERGTKLIGETRGQVQQGTARVFVLWTEARTPTGIVVPLDSPGTDELGRSGLPGEVNRHFWDRFGAAILISTLDGAVQATVSSTGRGGGAVIYNPSASESVITDVLKSTVNIPPTVTKRNGDRIQVFVARDVDFRSVYELRTVATGR